MGTTGTGESSYQPGPTDDAAMHCGFGLATSANAIAEAVVQSTGSLVDEEHPRPSDVPGKRSGCKEYDNSVATDSKQRRTPTKDKTTNCYTSSDQVCGRTLTDGQDYWCVLVSICVERSPGFLPWSWKDPAHCGYYDPNGGQVPWTHWVSEPRAQTSRTESELWETNHTNTASTVCVCV